MAAFKAGGAAALRKKLVGIAPTGTVRIGAGSATPTRFTLERATGDGRLLTILTDQPLLFVGAGAAGRKAKRGLRLCRHRPRARCQRQRFRDASRPPQRLKLNQDAFVVEDYGAEVVRLTAVKKTK